jgi:hypothetical protein
MLQVGSVESLEAVIPLLNNGDSDGGNPSLGRPFVENEFVLH